VRDCDCDWLTEAAQLNTAQSSAIWQLLSQSNKSSCTEPEGSLPCSQEHSTCSFLEPDQSTSHLPTLISLRLILLPSHLTQIFQVVSLFFFFFGFSHRNYEYISLPYVPHALPILSTPAAHIMQRLAMDFTPASLHSSFLGPCIFLRTPSLYRFKHSGYVRSSEM